MNDKHDDVMAAKYRKNPTMAVELLNNVLESGKPGEFMVALRLLAKAFGGVRGVAKEARLNPNQMYRTLSEHGNPELKTLTSILRAMGLGLAVRPLRKMVGKNA
ncbi:MAG: addiction module antidote protein [Desulfobulbaceae bacterium]|jgi:probable addiction module antidote protein|nr:addiction module antidote protein [Desulfobulbaceae bacterium]